MKFCHELLLEEKAAPKELQGRFLQYKALKKMLKKRLLTAVAEDAAGAREQRALEAEKDFLRALRSQLKEVDRKFLADAEAIIAHYDVVSGKASRNPLHTLLHCKLALRRSQDSEALLRLQQRVFWTKKYAELNATALRKIAKKRDKLCGGRVGQCFLQACFRGQIAIHAILSSPILRELTAVEELLDHQLAATKRAAPIQRLQISDYNGASELLAAPNAVLTGPDSTAADQLLANGAEEDFTCPICMDVLYQSVALECGHIFCARCAISLAVGHDRTVGNVDRLLPTIAAYSGAYANRPCPSCRSTVHGREDESVFWQIRRMKHLDSLIQQKFPEDWQRREQEDQEGQALLKAQRKEDSCLKQLARCCKRNLQQGFEQQQT